MCYNYVKYRFNITLFLVKYILFLDKIDAICFFYNSATPRISNSTMNDVFSPNNVNNSPIDASDYCNGMKWHAAKNEYGQMIADAACQAHLEGILYLLALNNIKITIYDINCALSGAAIYNHLNIMKYLIGLYPNVLDLIWAVDNATGAGSSDVVKYLVEEHKVRPSDESIQTAADRNYDDVVEYLLG